jgi:transketolase
MQSSPELRTSPSDAALARLARQARRLVLSAAHAAGAGHVGGSLSAIDLLVALYFARLSIDPARPGWPERDRFILSKGHCALGLYAVLALRGYLPVDELQTFDQGGTRLQMHPDMHRLPGLDLSTGSLGQGLSAGVGMAIGARLRGLPSRVWVMVGDGELQEGMLWEAIHVAPRYSLANLTLVVDRNGLQQYGWPARPGERGDRRDPWAGVDLRLVFAGFGWQVIETGGHDMAAIRAAMDAAEAVADRPTVILAATTKGRGVSFMEMTVKWHTGAVDDDQWARAVAELGEGGDDLDA